MANFDLVSVTALASSVAPAPSPLLTTGNPKTAKGEGYGYLTAILHLAPYKASGFNTCAKATAGCSAACLNTAGRGGFDSGIQRARIRKTKWLRADKLAFGRQLERDIESHARRAHANDLLPAVRLNGTSDLPFENLRFTWRDGSESTVFERFPDIQFYDYTKVVSRLRKPLPPNYDLTFSAADGNEDDTAEALALGARVAIVFRNRRKPNARAKTWNIPSEYRGRRVVDADSHDLRFLDPRGVYCGLRAKGLATKDTLGFVHDVDPA